MTPEARFTGTLARDAQSRVGCDTWWLLLELHQGPQGLPVHAMKRIGTGVPADLASKSLARALRRGTPVTVHAERCDFVATPTPHLRLLNVGHIDYQAPWPTAIAAELEPQP